MMLSLVFSMFAHADYFDTERRFQAEDQARAQAEAEAQTAREIADHNDKMSRFATAIADKLGGGYNFASKPCQSYSCYRYGKDWIGMITFDTNRGFQCYARVFPAGHEYRCVNPQTREHLEDYKNSNDVERPKKRSRR